MATLCFGIGAPGGYGFQPVGEAEILGSTVKSKLCTIGCMREQATICALNNAEWCDAVCRAHGAAGIFATAIWTQPKKAPPYYSNAITLEQGMQESQRAAIEGIGTGLPEGFSVKDSFHCLDLADSGFRPLFDATWVWLDPSLGLSRAAAATEWIRIDTEAGLERFEASWRSAGSPAPARVFPPALLREPAIAILAVERAGRVVAGCIANRSRGNVVGFSNFFAPASNRNRYRSAAISAVAQFAPDMPIVGYERGEELAGVLALGFRCAGPLRVWVRP